MTAQSIIEKSAKMLGYSGADDARLHSVSLNALNRIYAELFFLENNENFREIKDLSQKINLKERILFDVMPYGVASVIATALGDSENANYFAQVYNLKRKKCGNSSVIDTIPTV